MVINKLRLKVIQPTKKQSMKETELAKYMQRVEAERKKYYEATRKARYKIEKALYENNKLNALAKLRNMITMTRKTIRRC